MLRVTKKERIEDLEKRVEELEKHIYHLTCRYWRTDASMQINNYQPNFELELLEGKNNV